MDIEYDVFISHSSLDSHIAFMLCKALEKQEFKCWIAPRNVKVGLPYAESIVDGIENSKTLIILFSTNANNSSGVLKELEVANNSQIPIVPIRIEDIFPTKSMKFYIMANHWVDVLNPKSTDDFNSFIDEFKGTSNLKNIDIPVHGFIATDKIIAEEKSTTFSDYIFPFIVSFVLLIMFSDIIYPSLELKDVVYSFLALAFFIAKIFVVLFRKNRR